MALCSSGAPGVSGEEIGGPWVSASPEGGVRERRREQREPVWPEGRVRSRGWRDPCLARAGHPKRERGSLSALGCS